MNFHCFRCDEEFEAINEAIKHLKNVHHIVDNNSPIKCLKKNCSRTYFSIKTLKSHLPKCQNNTETVSCFFLALNYSFLTSESYQN